jgi:hypothetical protein
MWRKNNLRVNINPYSESCCELGTLAPSKFIIDLIHLNESGALIACHQIIT